MRGYRDQFEPEVADRIEKLFQRIEAIRYPTGSSRYYGLDLAMCLRAGALAGSLIVASALMEIYIRGLIVRYTEIAQSAWSRKVEAEAELEEMRQENFGRLLDHLVNAELFRKEDSETAKKIYKEIRIPTHHGLASRLLSRTKEDPFRALRFLFWGNTEVTLHEFEEFFEYEALPIIEDIVGIIERNQVKDYA